MPMHCRISPTFLRAALLGLFFAAAVGVSAAEGGFTSTLSDEQKNSAGLTLLTSEQRMALDQLIAVEITGARNEGHGELNATFVARRSDDERRQAGLDRLSPAQLTKLNGLVAAAVAATPKPKERPRIRDSDVFSASIKPEVHGEVSLTYGRTSGGGEIRGASMWVDYFDPAHGLTLGVGISRFTGKGLHGFYPGYGYGDPTSFYGSGIGFRGSPYRNFGDNYFPESDGLFLGLAEEANRPYYRGFNRR